VSSGTRDSWQPKSLPTDSEAARRIGDWAAGGTDQPLWAVRLDFRGADLSGGNFTGAWLTEAVLTGVSLAKVDLYRAHLEGADLSGADLAESSCIKATFDGACLRSACFDGADLSSASLSGVDAGSASFRGARFGDSSLIEVDLRGADLSNATMVGSSFDVLMDDRTTVQGMTGTVLGPATILIEGQERNLDGTELEWWLTERGARVEVLRPGGLKSPWTYYARIDEDFPRERPAGIVRRRLVNGVTVDEAFTRNLRWEPTEYLRRYELGHNDDDHVEITAAEADAFVERITRELGEQ
jgi:hypothetical protein